MNTPQPSAEISPYDRLFLPDSSLLHCLAGGEHRREMSLYFGAEAYVELSNLAHLAVAAARDAGSACVWLVPGIMGSQLGIPRESELPPDLVWLDPVDIVSGDIVKLRLTADSPVRALGLVHHNYLRLWLRLLAAGFEVRTFPYDWRRDVLQIGADLAVAIAQSARPAMLVAHSLGGLVARAALRSSEANALITRVVQLGTPNKGAASAALALEGCYPVVRHIARLDRLHDATHLARNVFASFTSVHQLSPDNGEFWRSLPAADERFAAVVGVGQVTCMARTIEHGQTLFRYSRAGDGTVSFDSARLPHVPSYLTQTEHSDLPRQPLVSATVIDILRHGHSVRLPLIPSDRDARVAVNEERVVSLEELCEVPAHGEEKIDWHSWSPEQRRHYLEGLNTPLPIAKLAGL